jgi:DNA-binding protein HU-beta
MAARKKMSKSQLMAELAGATGTDKKTAAAFVDALSNIAYRETKKAGEFTIPGIGKLINKMTRAGTLDQARAATPLQPVPLEFRAERVIKDSRVRGKFSRSKIRAAVEAVARRHSAS